MDYFERVKEPGFTFYGRRWNPSEHASYGGAPDDKLAVMMREVASARHLNLVETLAETIVQRCFEWPQVVSATVRIEKPAIFPDCIPGVEIRRNRG